MQGIGYSSALRVSFGLMKRGHVWLAVVVTNVLQVVLGFFDSVVSQGVTQVLVRVVFGLVSVGIALGITASLQTYVTTLAMGWEYSAADSANRVLRRFGALVMWQVAVFAIGSVMLFLLLFSTTSTLMTVVLVPLLLALALSLWLLFWAVVPAITVADVPLRALPTVLLRSVFRGGVVSLLVFLTGFVIMLVMLVPIAIALPPVAVFIAVLGLVVAMQVFGSAAPAVVWRENHPLFLDGVVDLSAQRADAEPRTSDASSEAMPYQRDASPSATIVAPRPPQRPPERSASALDADPAKFAPCSSCGNIYSRSASRCPGCLHPR